ncbi:MAG TPA: hypothetical protein VGM60_03605, partial [Pseudonocardia sp.]|uniref:hypothetical protein n=1 Tax=Pseudonocardia sp. TaxID=60912 RepID=UPI002F414EEE
MAAPAPLPDQRRAVAQRVGAGPSAAARRAAAQAVAAHARAEVAAEEAAQRPAAALVGPVGRP